MSRQEFCLYCNAPLDASLHGNSTYCDDMCSYQGKLQRSKEQYQKNKASLEAFNKIDKLLEMYYELYGSDHIVDAILLDNAGMDWFIARGEITMEDLPVKVLGNYGYCLFTNEKLKIWKLPTQE